MDQGATCARTLAKQSKTSIPTIKKRGMSSSSWKLFLFNACLSSVVFLIHDISRGEAGWEATDTKVLPPSQPRASPPPPQQQHQWSETLRWFNFSTCESPRLLTTFHLFHIGAPGCIRGNRSTRSTRRHDLNLRPAARLTPLKCGHFFYFTFSTPHHSTKIVKSIAHPCTTMSPLTYRLALAACGHQHRTTAYCYT